jgi:hypothetical protein
MTDRKKPGVAFWATVVVVVLLVAYPLSFGPASGGKSRTDRRERNPVTASTAAADADTSNSDTVQLGKLVSRSLRHAMSEFGSRVLFFWNAYVATWRLHYVIPRGWEPVRLLDLPPDFEGRISGARI